MQHCFILLPHLVNISARVSTEISTFTVSLLYMHQQMVKPSKIQPKLQRSQHGCEVTMKPHHPISIVPPKKKHQIHFGPYLLFQALFDVQEFRPNLSNWEKKKNHQCIWVARKACLISGWNTFTWKQSRSNENFDSNFFTHWEWQGTGFLVINLGGTGRWPSLHQDFLSQFWMQQGPARHLHWHSARLKGHPCDEKFFPKRKRWNYPSWSPKSWVRDHPSNQQPLPKRTCHEISAPRTARRNLKEPPLGHDAWKKEFTALTIPKNTRRNQEPGKLHLPFLSGVMPKHVNLSFLQTIYLSTKPPHLPIYL